MWLHFAVMLVVSLWLCLGRPDGAHAGGFRLLDQGASATAQGAAFAAQADDPSAIHYNPAGMTQLPGIQVYAGGSLVSGDTTFTSTSGATVHGLTPGTIANPPPSTFYLTASLRDLGVGPLENLSVGLGVAAPFGLLISYPETGPLSEVATRAALPLLDIKPAAAYRIAPFLSVGAGLDIYTFSDLLGDGHAEQKRIAGPEFALVGIPAGSVLEVNGIDTAVGFNLSILVTPLRTADDKPRINVGVVYRSPATLDLRGDFRVDSARTRAKTRLELPSIVTAAIAVWPLRDSRREWKLEVDADYVDWSSFRHLDVRLANGLTLPSPQKWSASYVVMVGTEYKWLAPAELAGWDIAARGGYIHSATPVPTKTFGPAIPDADYNAFSVGMGFLCRRPGRFLGLIPCGGDHAWAAKAIGVDIAYQVVLYDSRRISNNQDPRVNGRWETTTHVGALSLRLNF
jgi:long-chain fatty acid transport protein